MMWARNDAGASRLFGLAVSLMIGAALCGPGRASTAGKDSEVPDDAFSFQGFGTLGAARSSNGDAYILRSIRQPRGIGPRWTAKQDSVLGVQAQYRFGEQVSATVQAASYYRDDDSFDPDIMAAYLKYDPGSRFSVRLGRVPLDLLMLADTRMVGYSYIPIRTTSESYSVPLNYVDGIGARWNFPVGQGVLSLDGALGFAGEDLPRYKVSGSKNVKAAIDYKIGDWEFKYFYDKAWLKHEGGGEMGQALQSLRQVGSSFPDPSIRAAARHAADRLALKDSTGVYQSFGIGYDDGVWQAQIVLNSMRYTNVTLTNGKALHTFFGRRIGSLTPHVGYSRGKIDPKHLNSGSPLIDASVAELTRATGIAMNNETFTLGARWDFRPNMALKAQIDYLRGHKSGTQLVGEKTKPDWNGRTTMFNVSLDFVF